jgi:peptidoglycan/LPS O-acetylase OafA/YrhL
LNRSATSVHFPGLDALRVYAVLSIVIAHTSRNFANLRSAPASIPAIDVLLLDAQTAVNLLLVITGFLIAYRWFGERTAFGRVDIRRFWARRFLRIAPPYYATVAIGWLLIPLLLGPLPGWESPSIPHWILVLSLLPIFATSLGSLEHIWYVGLLSLFYLSWPLAVRRPGAAFLKIAFGTLIVKAAVAPVIGSFHSVPTANLFLGLRFESLAIGALGAYALFFGSPALKYLRGVPVKIAALGASAVLAVWDLPFTEPAILISSTVFILILMNFFTGSAAGRRLEQPWLKRLGGWSYGMYLYHYPLLYCLLVLLPRMGIPDGSAAHACLLHASVLGGTVLLSAVLYVVWERPFQSVKKKFTPLPARE